MDGPAEKLATKQRMAIATGTSRNPAGWHDKSATR